MLHLAASSVADAPAGRTDGSGSTEEAVTTTVASTQSAPPHITFRYSLRITCARVSTTRLV